MATRKNKSNKSNKFRKSNKSRKRRGGGEPKGYGRPKSKENRRLFHSSNTILSDADIEKKNILLARIKENRNKVTQKQNKNAEHKREYKKQQDEKKEAIISLMKKETNEVKKETNKAKRLTNEPIKSQESKKQKSTYYNEAEREILSEFDIPLTPSIPLNPYSSGGKRKTRKLRKSNRK